MDGMVIGIAMGSIQNAQGVNFALNAKEIADFLRTRPFITLTSQENNSSQSLPSTTQPSAANNSFAQQSSSPADFSAILEQLQLITPGQPAAKVREILGPPDRETTEGTISDIWYFLGNNAMLTTWYKNDGTVSRSTWLEYHDSREEAQSRLESLWNSAGRSFGKHDSASQNGRMWNRKGYVIAIEHHRRQGTNMVLFTAR
jgi:hypothetical protein